VTGHLLLRLTVTENGQVVFVKPIDAAVRPPEKADPVVAAMSACLSKREFPEAVVPGGYEVRTDFYLAFHCFAPAPADAPTETIAGGRTIPAAWLEEMLVEKVRLAGKLLEPSRAKEIRGPGWLLRTDVPPEVSKTIVEALEFAAAAFDAAFPGAPPVPEAGPGTIFVFREEDRFHQVAAFDNIEQTRARLAGEYNPRDRLIYTWAGRESPPAAVAGLVAHEVTHHLVQQRLYGAGRRPPFWVTEGIAVLIQCLEPDAPGKIDLAAFQRGKLFKGPWRWRAPADAYLDALGSGLRKGSLPSLRTLMGRDWTLDVVLAYGTSWVLVHYLMTAEGGKHRAAFRSWMAGPDAEGDGASLALALGVPLDDLEAAVRRHLKLHL
jgi:hypothetical protein